MVESHVAFLTSDKEIILLYTKANLQQKIAVEKKGSPSSILSSILFCIELGQVLGLWFPYFLHPATAHSTNLINHIYTIA